MADPRSFSFYNRYYLNFTYNHNSQPFPVACYWLLHLSPNQGDAVWDFHSRILGENLMKMTKFSEPQILAFQRQGEGGVRATVTGDFLGSPAKFSFSFGLTTRLEALEALLAEIDLSPASSSSLR